MTAKVVVVGGIGSQSALGAGLSAVPSFVKSPNPYGEGLKQLFHDITLGIVEVT